MKPKAKRDKQIKKKISNGKKRLVQPEGDEEGIGLSDLVKRFLHTPDQAIQKLASTTQDIKAVLGAEFKKQLEKIDISKELEKVLDKYDFEIEAKVRLKKKSSPLKKDQQV